MSVKLLAGTPNDANRDYVPMGIKGTDMTVNENGNNSQVYPQRLRECTGVLADGRVCKFARGVIGCLVDDNLYAMYCETLHREGELLVSVEWFCRFLFNLNVSFSNDVVYVTDHFAELSDFMAELIKEELK